MALCAALIVMLIFKKLPKTLSRTIFDRVKIIGLNSYNLEAYPVAALVNSPRNNRSEFVVRVNV